MPNKEPKTMDQVSINPAFADYIKLANNKDERCVAISTHFKLLESKVDQPRTAMNLMKSLTPSENSNNLCELLFTEKYNRSAARATEINKDLILHTDTGRKGPYMLYKSAANSRELEVTYEEYHGIMDYGKKTALVVPSYNPKRQEILCGILKKTDGGTTRYECVIYDIISGRIYPPVAIRDLWYCFDYRLQLPIDWEVVKLAYYTKYPTKEITNLSKGTKLIVPQSAPSYSQKGRSGGRNGGRSGGRTGKKEVKNKKPSLSAAASVSVLPKASSTLSSNQKPPIGDHSSIDFKSLSSSFSKEIKDMVTSQLQLFKNQDRQSGLLANDMKDIISSQLQLTKQHENQKQDLIMKNQELELKLQYETQLKDKELHHLNQVTTLNDEHHKNEMELMKEHYKMTIERDDIKYNQYRIDSNNTNQLFLGSIQNIVATISGNK